MNESTYQASDTMPAPPPNLEERLHALESRQDRLSREMRTIRKAQRQQGYEQDLVMHALQALIKWHAPIDEEGDRRDRILAAFAERERRRAEDREAERDETAQWDEDTRPSGGLKI